MIKAIITDVDGVIIGDKKGFNFPHPTQEVQNAFKVIQKKGIPVVLCTGKASYVVENTIRLLELKNPHIGDGGTYIFDPLAKKILKKHLIDPKIAQDVIRRGLDKKLHMSITTTTDTFIDASHKPHITERRRQVLGKDLIVVPSLEKYAESVEILKILATTTSREEDEAAQEIFDLYADKTHFIWTHHPVTAPWRYALMTAKDASKITASQEVAKILGVNLSNVLGIGDTLGDWIFMEKCGYVGVVGEGSLELIKKVKTKGEGNYFLAPSVDEDGMVKILEYFHLI